MHISEVLDIDTTYEKSTPLKAGDKITVQAFKLKHVDQVDADVVEIKTTDGMRHSFGKAIIGQAKSDYYQDALKKCIEKDSSDGLDVWVVEKEAEGTGRMMLSLSTFEPKH
tara:strand:- start:13114 stop:13446 length:333 start_codon:yes stop_codon:yes gene_type:complete